MAGLTIYKASAGSGKTFRLTLHYLKMVLEHDEVYKRILAVTFTNKATAEMKTRILDELYNLAGDNESRYKALLLEDLNLDSIQLISRAQKALNNILHDYSRFTVSTIDNFFQRIIRTFTREIGLQSGYTLETDDSEILNYVVDELILATGENEKLKEWLVDFARNRMQDAKSWNFRDEILELAKELSKEAVKALDFMSGTQKQDDVSMNEYVQLLNKRMHFFENTLKKYGEEGVKWIEQSGLTVNDFNYKGSGVAQYFYYLKQVRKDKLGPNKNTLKVLDDPEKWPSGKLDKHAKDQVQQLAANQLNGLLNKIISFYNDHIQEYRTVSEIFSNVYVLGILKDIQDRVREYCREKNLFLISDAADLLRKIIQNNEAPFIYEKAGSVYNHFMIDEFQDNSRFQWENFQPLIKDSLSQNGTNLVVGDIKQSIYRWRNGDWEILDREIEKEFHHFPVDVQTLDRNFRSCKNVVAYNNTIFHFLPGVLQANFDNNLDDIDLDNHWAGRIETAYQDAKQFTGKEQKGGYISHRFLTFDSAQEVKDRAKSMLIKDIERLQDAGYKLSDIAIIVRKNSEGQEIANALLEYKNRPDTQDKYKYDVISNDSLYLKNAESVRFLLSVLKYFIDPGNDINNAFIKECYERKILKKDYEPSDLHHLFEVNKESFEKIIPSAFFENYNTLRRLPLFELTEELIRLFEINRLEGETPYIQAFQNLIMDFSNNNPADLNTFLDWWEKNGGKERLQLPERNEAIKIITIHKAKGLEFKAVLIPFCNWEIDEVSKGFKKNYLWCAPKREGLNKISAVPVNYKSGLSDTDFQIDYVNEKFHNYVDNLNLLYVALTRAREVLISYSPLRLNSKGEVNYKANKKGMVTIGDSLHFFFESSESLPNPENNEKPLVDQFGKYWNPDEMIFEYGSMEKVETEKETAEELLYVDHYPVNQQRAEVHFQKNHSDFFNEKPDLFQERIDYGKIMHQIFENIICIEDIPKALDIVYREGKIDSTEKEKLKKDIEMLINQPKVNSWFIDEWNVFTEKEILLPNGSIYRPDRVMRKKEKTVVVDYKFGEKHSSKYKKQMLAYLNTIKKMGFPNPEGYLWYISQNEIVEVNL